MSGEGDQVAAVGAPGVRGGAGVGQIGEEIVQVPGERVCAAELLGDDRIHRADLHYPPGCQITVIPQPRARRPRLEAPVALAR
ncbi:hypothetical protein [Nonomuraea turcica]|uniref:hypothetical protein n=1 Tax=Nonomuraea sp. G32 TaxID=3067274 RepID=UPI00273B4A1D|nr:hypothetical protein [Nonomuraea sp. G32]MDP4502656.1 hypothetical protein [Nonomuraea sp. G32]